MENCIVCEKKDSLKLGIFCSVDCASKYEKMEIAEKENLWKDFFRGF